MTTNDAALVVVDDPSWAPVRDALLGMNDALSQIGQLAREQLFPRAMRVAELLADRRRGYATAGAFHAACQEQIGLSRSAVESYLQLHRNRDQLQAAIDNGIEIGGLKAALALLRSPRPEPAALPAGGADHDATDAEVIEPLPVALDVTATPAAHGAGDLLAPLRQAQLAVVPLMQHPRLQDRPDLIGRLDRLVEALEIVARALAEALEPTSPPVVVDQQDLSLAPSLVDADATDQLLADELELPVEAVVIDTANAEVIADGKLEVVTQCDNPATTTAVAADTSKAKPSTKRPLSKLYPREDPTAHDRLVADIDRAGGQSYLAAKHGITPQGVSYHLGTLRKLRQANQAA
jgi:hypothetical protein